MRVGSIVRSNVDYQIGIVTNTRKCEEYGWIVKRFCVLFADCDRRVWLSSQVLDLICE